MELSRIDWNGFGPTEYKPSWEQRQEDGDDDAPIQIDVRQWIHGESPQIFCRLVAKEIRDPAMGTFMQHHRGHEWNQHERQVIENSGDGIHVA
jgi:hypothetical protein